MGFFVTVCVCVVCTCVRRPVPENDEAVRLPSAANSNNEGYYGTSVTSHRLNAATADCDLYESRDHAETILRQMATLYAARQVRSEDVLCVACRLIPYFMIHISMFGGLRLYF